MNVSLVIPVRNEEKTIRLVLDCIMLQSRKPNEIIIADGGSTDRTIEIIKEYESTLPIKVIEIGPAYPGKGRNHAIMHCSNDYIAMTDAGLKLRPDWLQNLLLPLLKDSSLDVVFGCFKPVCTNNFLKATALFVAQDKDKHYNSRFPTIASMLIRKDVYQKLGGCPEELRSAEDSVFFRRLFEYNANFAVAEKAVVDWQMNDSWIYLIRKSFHAAKYEILGGYIRKRSLILMVIYPFFTSVILCSFTWVPMLSVVLLICFCIRITGSKRMDPELYSSLVSSLSGVLWLAIVTIVADIAHIVGNINGYYFYLKAQDKPKLHLWRGARFQT